MKIKIRSIDIVGIAIGLLFFLFILSKGYQTFPDSGSYIYGQYLHVIPIFQVIFVLLSFREIKAE